ncbi:MAG: hypothetical protein AAFV88_03940 [Planctomycetota bacterium]
MTTEQEISPLEAMRRLSDRRKTRRSDDENSIAGNALQLMRGLSESRSVDRETEDQSPAASLGSLLHLAESRHQAKPRMIVTQGLEGDAEPPFGLGGTATLEQALDQVKHEIAPPREINANTAGADLPVDSIETAPNPNIEPEPSGTASKVNEKEWRTDQYVVLPSPAFDEFRCDPEPLERWPVEEPPVDSPATQPIVVGDVDSVDDSPKKREVRIIPIVLSLLMIAGVLVGTLKPDLFHPADPEPQTPEYPRDEVVPTEHESKSDALDKRRNDLLAEINSSVGDELLYASALRRYIDEFPDDARSQDLRHVLETELSAVSLFRVWNDYDTQLAKGVDSLTPPQAARLLGEADSLRRQLPTWEVAGKLADETPYLEAIRRRQDGSIVEELIATLSNASLRAPHVFYCLNKGCYYYQAPPRERVGKTSQGRSIRLTEASCFSGFATEQNGTGQVPVRSCFFDAQEFSGRHCNRTLIRETLDNVVESLKTIDQGDWDASFLHAYETLEAAYANGEAEDCPEFVMRVHVLRSLLRAGARGSEHMAMAFGPALEILCSMDLEPDLREGERHHGRWLNPDNSPASLLRECTEALDRAALQHCVERANQPVKAHQPAAMTWVGWLFKQDDGQWVCEPQGESPLGSKLLMLVPDSTTTYRVIPMDAMQDVDTWSQLERDGLALEGTPIFSISR